MPLVVAVQQAQAIVGPLEGEDGSWGAVGIEGVVGGRREAEVGIGAGV